MFTVALTLIIIIVILAITYSIRFFNRSQSIWTDQGIPISPYYFLQTIKLPFHVIDTDLIPKYGKVVGSMTFFQPALLIGDLDLIRKILNDIDNFPNRLKLAAERNITGENILFARYAKWKHLRQIMTPTFSPKKIRQMQQLIEASVHDLIEALETVGGQAVNVNPYFSGFTLDVIANCCFGIKTNSAKDPNNDVVKFGQKFFGLGVSFSLIMVLLFPDFATEKLNMIGFQPDAAQFFSNLTKQIVRTRRSANYNVHHNDFIDLLLKAERDGKSLTDKEIADQGIAFFLAGFDTSSVTLTNMSYLLAKHQNIQSKLVQEIDRFLANNEGKELNYDTISELKYLDAVINETMRLMPTVPRMFREADRNCVLKYQQSNEPNERQLFIPKGTNLSLSIYSLHHDEENFEKPFDFIPERFCNQESCLRHNLQAFMPFGIGHRNCIGSRFALFEIKLCLLMLLGKFKFELSASTEPLQFLESQPVMGTKTMNLKLIKR